MPGSPRCGRIALAGPCDTPFVADFEHQQGCLKTRFFFNTPLIHGCLWCYLGGLAAAVFGLIDWLAIPSGTRAKAVGMWHGATNVVMVGLFIVSWLLRANAPGDPGIVAIVLSFVAVGLASLGGFLGGELVVRLGVGVAEGAHLNAPSSLSGRPVGRSSTGAQREE